MENHVNMDAFASLGVPFNSDFNFSDYQINTPDAEHMLSGDLVDVLYNSVLTEEQQPTQVQQPLSLNLSPEHTYPRDDPFLRQPSPTDQKYPLLSSHLAANRLPLNGSPNNPLFEQPQPQQKSLMTNSSQSSMAQWNQECSPKDSTMASQSDDESENGMYDQCDQSMSSSPPAPKGRRRKAHNVIEKRYRASINQCIIELKGILAPDQAKVSKSATLRLAIDHITDLRKENERLRTENNMLKQNVNSGMVPKYEPRDAQGHHSMSAYSPSSSSSRDSPPLPTKNTRRSGETARVTMFAILLAWVVINPLGMIMGNNGATSMEHNYDVNRAPGGRVLQSAYDIQEPHKSWWDDGIFRFLCLWLLNGLVISCILARMLIYGEPTVDGKSSYSTAVMNKRQSARRNAEIGNSSEASHELNECLQLLNRAQPTGLWDELTWLIWQCCRQMLNICAVGYWIPRQREKLFKGVSVGRSSAEASLVYDDIHQLQLSFNTQTSRWHALGTALAAVNLGEVCPAKHMTREKQSEMYIRAAIRCKLTFENKYLRAITSWYFLRKARSVSPQANKWLFTPTGLDFWASLKPQKLAILLAHDAKKNQNVPSVFMKHLPNCKDHGNTFDRLLRGYKLYVLEQVITTVVNGTNLNDYSRAITQCHALLGASHDEHSNWWTQLFLCANLWQAGNNSVANERYDHVRRIPGLLMENPIAMSVGHAFCARKLCQENRHQKHYERVVLMHARKAYDFLVQAVKDEVSQREKLHNISIKLTIDWILTCCVEIWMDALKPTVAHWQQPLAPNVLTFQYKMLQLYQRQVDEDKKGNNGIHVNKLQVHLTSSMMMSGAQPLLTWQSLKQCSKIHLSLNDYNRLRRMIELHQNANFM